MSVTRRILLGLAVVQAFAVSGIALDWKTTTITLTLAPFQTEQNTVFEFTNRTEVPVTIRELETSCSCLVASSDSKIYPPGASGKITARFTIGDRVGLYERLITVDTDESSSPTRLSLRVEVPATATASPRSVTWTLNEEIIEKTVDLIPVAGFEIIFSDPQTTSDDFTVRLESIESGKSYRLHIKPNSTAQRTSAAVRISGREKSGHDVVISAYASVH
jgi:hypothetical protein